MVYYRMGMLAGSSPSPVEAMPGQSLRSDFAPPARVVGAVDWFCKWPRE